MARPKIAEEERLTERLAFRTTAMTKKMYLQRIEESGMTPSEFIRNAVMTNATEIIIQAPVSKDAREALRLLKNIANNCNQLAHALNTALLSGLVSDSMVEVLLREITKTLEYAKKVRNDVV